MVSRIKALPRPLIIHFIQVIASSGDDSANITPSSSGKFAAAASSSASDNKYREGQNKPLPTFDGDV